MPSYRSLNHTKWACQYHVVFIPSIGSLQDTGRIPHYYLPIAQAAHSS